MRQAHARGTPPTPPTADRRAPGRPRARRSRARAIAAADPGRVAANFVGAVVVFVAARVWVLPLPDLADRDTVLIVNLVAAAAYLRGRDRGRARVWGAARAGAARVEWLRGGPRARPRTSAARRCASPLRQLRGLAGAVAGGGRRRVRAQRDVVVVRSPSIVGRDDAARRDHHRRDDLPADRAHHAAPPRRGRSPTAMPEKPVLPGVTTRALLAWALGSGVPLAGLVRGRDRRPRRAATSASTSWPTTALVLGGVAIGRRPHRSPGRPRARSPTRCARCATRSARVEARRPRRARARVRRQRPRAAPGRASTA